jgi:hypothetical protein
MPLPGREQTFAFANCRELLQKLDREIDRYREVIGRSEHELGALVKQVDQLRDSAFNASVTAWHLADWVFNDMTEEQRKGLRFTTLGDLQAHVRTNCQALYLCRHVATASKHWAVDKHPDPDVQVMVTCDDEVGWIVYFAHGGNKVAADQVFEEALSFWTGFIYQYHIAKEPDVT